MTILMPGVAAADPPLVLSRSLRVPSVRAAAGGGLHHILLPSGQLPGRATSE